MPAKATQRNKESAQPMTISVPVDKPIPLQAALPAGMRTWPGPPSWGVNHPDVMTLRLTHDNQMLAELIVAESDNLPHDAVVTLDCLDLHAEVQLAFSDETLAPSAPIVLSLQ